MNDVVSMPERRKTTRPALVYLLWLDHSVLDVYTDPSIVHAEAERFVVASHDDFQAARPGRWIGRQGRLLEIEPREIKTFVSGQRRVA